MRFSSILSLFFGSAVLAHGTANYKTLQTSQDGATLTVTINNKASNVNLMSEIVIIELDHLVTSLQNDTSVKVVLFKSGNPNFFSAHFDLIQRPGNNVFFNVTELPQATIAVVEGPARGLANEFIFSCDMRFASKKAVFGNFEVSLGGHPGTGGALYMAKLIGRARAFEYLLSGKDIDSHTAEKYGWINQAFESSKELAKYVKDLSSRISLFPIEAIASNKASVNSITRPTKEELAFEAHEYEKLISIPSNQQLIGKFFKLTKNETDVKVELNLGEEVPKLYQ
ncbi:enoyl-CoA hydratase/isomerase family protein [Mariannaea sp. PMI_226]|nr:enoyl-CoA hydratase/isomerase family protein [Mariannaea sp. PMI_226]